MDSEIIAILGVIGMVIFDVVLVLYLNPKINRKYAMNLWNDRIPLLDVDGSVIKVPMRYQDGDGEIKTKEEIAPLWLTVAYSLGRFGAEQMKLWFMSQKAKTGAKLDKLALEKVQAGEIPAEMLIDVIPKKWHKYVAGYELISEIAGRGIPTNGDQRSQTRARGSSGSFNPGLKG